MIAINWGGGDFHNPLGDDWRNVHRAKAAVPGTHVKIACFNEADVAEYREKFTAEELKHISFSWLTWPTKSGSLVS